MLTNLIFVMIHFLWVFSILWTDVKWICDFHSQFTSLSEKCVKGSDFSKRDRNFHISTFNKLKLSLRQIHTTKGIVDWCLLAVKGLKDAEYEFRVRAKNSAGVSEPSNPIIVDVKPKTCKYGNENGDLGLLVLLLKANVVIPQYWPFWGFHFGFGELNYLSLQNSWILLYFSQTWQTRSAWGNKDRQTPLRAEMERPQIRWWLQNQGLQCRSQRLPRWHMGELSFEFILYIMLFQIQDTSFWAIIDVLHEDSFRCNLIFTILLIAKSPYLNLNFIIPSQVTENESVFYFILCR